MQDNGPCHTAKIVEAFYSSENIQLLSWLAQSPDLNPIENLWKIICYKVRENHPTTVENLWQKIQEEWKKDTPELCKRLVKSCGRRCH